MLALDIGEKRIGVAVSDPSGRVATPLKVLDTAEVLRDLRSLSRLVEDYGAERVVVGLPISLDGTEGPQARRVRSLVARIDAALPPDIVYVDERLSSTEAKRRMSETGMSERDMRGSVDMVAAAVLLQGYLDSHAL